MNPYVLAVLISTLALGTAVTFASSHWLMAWMGLELNTLAILPLMSQDQSPRAVEATTKYFLTQATAAAVILFASTTNAWIMGEWGITQVSHPATATLIAIALAMKVGLAPMHLWLPDVLQGLDLTAGLVLSTWQKLAPFAILIQVAPTVHPMLLTIMGLASVLVGGWGGMNQTQLRKILAYSSIAHLGWMMVVIQYAADLAFFTLIIYITMTSAAFLTFKMTSSMNIGTLALSWTKFPVLAPLAAMTLLSLGGLPPLTGFMPKWLILEELAKQGLSLLAVVTALSALLSLYFYLRLSYALTLTVSPGTTSVPASWRLYSKANMLPLALFIILTLCLLPMLPALFSVSG
uniref:NADH-ubiquinone oxidoreductase chain 2 n=1 Tax=Gonorynchus abbreviatus TaxID=189504 RepID=B3LEE6_9TELE|nr:NADH dehydrogenase subunit 2 [Gonorynchus abbreviatus]BAG49372.1 NADH dehydrogenase subunit 2 [Gonorynchus abbreviatus]